MINTQKQRRLEVCTLEQAQKFKELGVNLKSLWAWVSLAADRPLIYTGVKEREYLTDWQAGQDFPAYSCSELGRLLPKRLNIDGEGFEQYELCLRHGHLQYRTPCKYRLLGDQQYYISVGDHEASARAQMLINLIEHGLVDVNELAL